ncbi:hypothetical protein PG984_011406 [Apiospora sp. TS-2023a]
MVKVSVAHILNLLEPLTQVDDNATDLPRVSKVMSNLTAYFDQCLDKEEESLSHRDEEIKSYQSKITELETALKELEAERVKLQEAKNATMLERDRLVAITETFKKHLDLLESQDAFNNSAVRYDTFEQQLKDAFDTNARQYDNWQRGMKQALQSVSNRLYGLRNDGSGVHTQEQATGLATSINNLVQGTQMVQKIIDNSSDGIKVFKLESLLSAIPDFLELTINCLERLRNEVSGVIPQEEVVSFETSINNWAQKIQELQMVLDTNSEGIE